MTRSTGTVLAAILSSFALLPGAVYAEGAAVSPYAGFEQRSIRSLSEADIEELRRGGGWGLALAAELNGCRVQRTCLNCRTKSV